VSEQDRLYTAWVRSQPCCACGTSFQIEPHHALYGTTYSPEEPRPPKAIDGARKGGAQKSHDFFQIPLCFKCHEPGIHQLRGFFAGWNRVEANAFEEKQVGIHRNRYAVQAPAPVPTPGKPARSRIGAGWTVATIRDWLRREAPTRPAPVAAALSELADLIERDTF
jgi:hypothetical protein